MVAQTLLAETTELKNKPYHGHEKFARREFINTSCNSSLETSGCMSTNIKDPPKEILMSINTSNIYQLWQIERLS